MVIENGNNPEKRDGSQGFQLKPPDYQPTKEELAPISQKFPAEVVMR